MLKIIVLNLIFFSLKAKDKFVESCPKRKEFSSAITDQVLVGPVVHSFTSNGEILCQFNCHVNDNCDRYNFNDETNQCEMLDKLFTYTTEKRIGWMFKTIKCEDDPCHGFSCYENKGPVCLCTFDWMGKHCEIQDLGIEDKTLQDSQMTASSYFDTGHEPYRGRINNYPRLPYRIYVDTGVWAAKYNQVGEYLQVSLLRMVTVAMVATQGRPYVYTNQRVTKYQIRYKDPKTTVWQDYKRGGIIEAFPGNSDANTIVRHTLVKPIRTQDVRFIVLQWNAHISMRVGLYGY